MFKIISSFLKRRHSRLQKRKRVGLSWFKEKKLKHDNSTHEKSYALFGKPLFYTVAPDLLHGIEEIFIDECYKISLSANPFILDCGGNIGLSTLYFSKLFPSAKIITFEPDRHNYALLEKNVRSYGLSNVELRQEAVWNEETTLQFEGDGSLGSSIARSQNDHTYDVPAVRLGTYLNRRVSLLKLDIEGAEYEVVKDIKDKLGMVDNIFLEYHSTFEDEYKLIELLTIIKDAGFQFYMREVFEVYPTPFFREVTNNRYDIQLNIYCFRQ
ncbi:MAG: FkbM family methyltransferase [Bacteroidetes bacterium]|nr:FkbM family methyltransferase [Bacteroidota bacterium]MBS1628733.1 FkbM family methyltransferase [Bacteroidota bacterium]